jgi:hypothetical protein
MEHRHIEVYSLSNFWTQRFLQDEFEEGALCMYCKIAGFNAHGFLLLGVQKGPDVPHMNRLFARFEKKKHHPFCGRKHSSNMWQRFQGIYDYQMDDMRATKGDQVEVQ